MSSTACLEAIDHGSRVGLILDLGIHERYGNQVFLDSGLLRTFGQLQRDAIGEAADEWRASYFFARKGSATQELVDRVEELISTGERPSQAVWASDYFGSSVEFRTAQLATKSVRPVKSLRRRVIKAILPPVLSRSLKRLV